MSKSICFSSILLFMLLLLHDVSGQKWMGKKVKPSPLHIDSLDVVRTQLFNFPNVNRVAFYQNKVALKALSKAEKQQDLKTYYSLLLSYVQNFGIENFDKDNDMLWKLAQLTEKQGRVEEAKFLYKLVLKHTRQTETMKSIRLYFDTVQNDAENYVPLTYYYELVAYRQEVDTLRPPRGVLINMGEDINSDAADYAPSIHPNNELMLFTSQRNFTQTAGDKRKNEDLFYSIKVGDIWTEGKSFDGINTAYNEGSGYLSRDGRTLFFARCYSPDSYGNCDILYAVKDEKGKWSKAENLGPQVNTSSWESHPSLSHTEDTLYFASDRLGGFGLADIYFTYKLPSGKWSAAQNAGPIINTRNNELSPFYHPTREVLYFSSMGQLLNFGDFDIYKSSKKNGQWQAPKNIGPLVNGAGSEYYFSIDPGSKALFYARSSSSELENLDLFSFPLPMEAQPDAYNKFQGSLTDSISGKPFKGIVSVIDLDHGIEVAPKFLGRDGTFDFDLIGENNYLLIIQGDDYFRIEEIFYLEGDMEYHKKTTPIANKLKFTSVEFDPASSAIKASMMADLNKISDFLLDHPTFKLDISGHTDSDGKEDQNLILSQRRADAIKKYIIEMALIDPERITAIGFGSTRPIVKEVTEEDRRLNRRVEFDIFRPAQ